MQKKNVLIPFMSLPLELLTFQVKKFFPLLTLFTLNLTRENSYFLKLCSTMVLSLFASFIWSLFTFQSFLFYGYFYIVFFWNSYITFLLLVFKSNIILVVYLFTLHSIIFPLPTLKVFIQSSTVHIIFNLIVNIIVRPF